MNFEAKSVLTFEPLPHIYRLDGQRVPSVTGVLQAITNFDRVPFDILEAARIFGHHVHKAVDLFNRGVLDETDLDPALVPRLKQYKRFLRESKFQVVHSEEQVAHRTHGYAGTLDIRGMLHRHSALVDLKSGVVPRSVGPQTAGYQAACEHRPRNRYCLQLMDNDYRLFPLKNGSDFSMFLSCLNVYRFNQKDFPYG